mgnify:CR=1 FL=1
MNQKSIGMIVVIVSIVLLIVIYGAKRQEDKFLNEYVKNEGSCFLDDGTCLHASQNKFVFAGWILATALAMLGFYLIFFDRTQQILVEQNEKVSSALETATRQEKEKKEFESFLSAFRPEEQLILKTVKMQEGITQSTLRFKTGLSKTRLSLFLASLEDRGFIARRAFGKTNQVFLKVRK